MIEPMPRSVRRIRPPDTPRIAAMLAVARRGGPPAAPRRLAGSPLLTTWRRRATGAAAAAAATASSPTTAAPAAAPPPAILSAAPTSTTLNAAPTSTTLRAAAPAGAPSSPSPTASPDAAAPAAVLALGGAAGAPFTVDVAIDALEARDGDLTCEFGDWHGDWVPWNMARHRGTLLVWDWENHGTDAPIGFDLAHQAFQTALSTHGRPAAACAEAADAALRTHGPALGLDTARQRFVADAYLIELWLRTYELSHGGAGWNPKLHPALLHVLATRLGGHPRPATGDARLP